MNVNRIHTPPHPLPSNRPSASPAGKAFEERLQPGSATSSGAAASESEQVITPSEKAYFERLYPASVEAVRAYTPYHRDGSQTVANVGSLVDRRG
jgi:hypothetical protein